MNLKLNHSVQSNSLWISLLLLFATATASLASRPETNMAPPPIEGRWDITIDIDGKPSPSWLEVRHSGYKTLIGQFTGTSGSARPIAEVYFKDNKMSFSIPPQWEKGSEYLKVEGTLADDKLTGSLTTSDGKTHSWKGVRAPILKRTNAPVWGKAVKLFNGKDLAGWHAEGANQWVVKDGVLVNPKSGSNLVTDTKYDDFKLHIEFRIPKGSNSGVYLRGRYEVQVTDSKGMEPELDQMGAVYGFIKPSEMVAKEAGEWNTLDITLVGRMITLVANGKTVITNQEIPGITGGAIDSHEGEPGPLLIQGDHGAVEYRNIVITPAK